MYIVAIITDECSLSSPLGNRIIAVTTCRWICRSACHEFS